MDTIYADTVIAVQIINGVVRIQMGMLRAEQTDEGAPTKSVPCAEIILPLSGFTDLANTCTKVAAGLIEKGVMNRGPAPGATAAAAAVAADAAPKAVN